MSNILKFKKRSEKKEKKLKHVNLLVPTVQNINGVDVPCYGISEKHMEEWKTNRTIDGKKVTAEIAKEIDLIMQIVEENQDKFLKV